MKKRLFISYSNKKFNKVKLIEKELTNHPLFQPIVIANMSRPSRPFVDKVTKGINSSYRIILILTKESINNQWLNQEIGYAFGKDIQVIPIVEEKIMKRLKGFVNNQDQFPYCYKTKAVKTMRDENNSFIACFRLLIKNLETELKPKVDEKLEPSLMEQISSSDPVANVITNIFQ